jgi:broad-specificity NMP kinase
MVSKWIVLIGPPAVGKTTLSNQIKNHLNANYYSFDQEFPLKILKESNFDSKNHRIKFLDRIKEDDSEWIIIDDTCHLRSMQKRYVHASEDNHNIKVKVVFLYLSARNDEIVELKERNYRRESIVTNEEIEKITKHLNLSKFGWSNLIEYNFNHLPSIGNIVEDIQRVVDECRPRNIGQVRVRDLESDSNFFSQLNLTLNKEISEAFKIGAVPFDGKRISIAKKKFIEAVRDCYDGHDDILELVSEFRNKYLQSPPGFYLT